MNARTAARLLRYLDRSDHDEPCVHGHGGCATRSGGTCVDEAWHALYGAGYVDGDGPTEKGDDALKDEPR